jgi:hypothetical protein
MLQTAARLLKIQPLNIWRWLGGYSYTAGDQTVASVARMSEAICGSSGAPLSRMSLLSCGLQGSANPRL